jgi:methyl-galactoside transport system substrate-binding protein
MKKISRRSFIKVAAAAAAASALAACGSSSTAASTAAGSTAASAGGAAASGTVGVFWYNFSDTYLSSVRTALDADLEAAGIAYQDYDGNSDQGNQTNQIDTAISSGAPLLIVNQVTSGSSDTATTICEKAKAANVPVIFFNRAIEEDNNPGAVLGAYDNIAFVGTDAPEAGHMQGKMIGNYLVAHYDEIDLNGDGIISYDMFKGDANNVEAIYRTQFGVEDCNAVLKENGYPELQYFDSSAAEDARYQLDMDGNWSATAANNYMTTNLSQYSEANKNMIELVICNNDNMAEGAISALNAAGYNLGDGKSTTIPVFGVDATDSAKQLISAGKMTGTIKQDAQGMADCIAFLATNNKDGKALMDGTDSYTKDTENKLDNKIYIAYQEYSG